MYSIQFWYGLWKVHWVLNLKARSTNTMLIAYLHIYARGHCKIFSCHLEEIYLTSSLTVLNIIMVTTLLVLVHCVDSLCANSTVGAIVHDLIACQQLGSNSALCKHQRTIFVHGEDQGEMPTWHQSVGCMEEDRECVRLFNFLSNGYWSPCQCWTHNTIPFTCTVYAAD